MDHQISTEDKIGCQAWESFFNEFEVVMIDDRNWLVDDSYNPPWLIRERCQSPLSPCPGGSQGKRCRKAPFRQITTCHLNYISLEHINDKMKSLAVEDPDKYQDITRNWRYSLRRNITLMLDRFKSEVKSVNSRAINNCPGWIFVLGKGTFDSQTFKRVYPKEELRDSQSIIQTPFNFVGNSKDWDEFKSTRQVNDS